MCSVCRSAVSVDSRQTRFVKKKLKPNFQFYSLKTSKVDVFCVCVIRTRMSRQAALSRVIWSAMVSVVKPGSCLANSTVLMMHLVDSSLNLSHRSTSKDTRRSELLVCTNKGRKYLQINFISKAKKKKNSHT